MADLKMLYSVCERLSEELENANRRIEKTDKLNPNDIEYLDKLTHALKSVKTVIAMEEAYDDEYSNDYRGNSYRNYYDGNSYVRGRTGNVRRDSMGRYSKDNKSMVTEIHELINSTTDERTRRELQRLVNEMQ